MHVPFLLRPFDRGYELLTLFRVGFLAHWY